MDFFGQFKKNVKKAMSEMPDQVKGMNTPPAEPGAEGTAAPSLEGVPNALCNQGPVTHPHALADYISRFDAMVAALQARPDIAVLGYNKFPPVTESQLAAFEEELGFALPIDLKTFYRQTDGLQLRWISTENEDYDPSEHVWDDAPVDWNWSRLDDWPMEGVVMIHPLWDVLNEYGEGTYYEEDDDYAWKETYLGQKVDWAEFRRNLRMFDFYANETDMTLYLNPKGPCTLILGHDSQSAFDMSAFVDIGTYLEFLIARKGRVGDRHSYFFRRSKTKSEWLYGNKDFWDGKTVDLDAARED